MTSFPQGTQEEWRRVWFLYGGVYMFGWICYTILADAEEQPWNKVDFPIDKEPDEYKEKDQGYTNDGYQTQDDLQTDFSNDHKF